MQHVLSVTEINRYIKEVISRDMILSKLWVRGEISNFKNHISGHMYFTVKDEGSILRCIMFRSHNSGLQFIPENGLKVIIKGNVSVYERDGQYQLYAEEMQPDGMGSLHLAFEQLKIKLQSEGLFDASYKKKIPLLPKSIGVVTSPTGAVIRDIINVLNRRYNNFNLKLYPVSVQGEQAPRQIAGAIDKLNELRCVDVIIVARGGGSLEELWAFNTEMVARSIFNSEIPIISAVGHETDFTISDFAADLRAPTPSAAAELVMPEKTGLLSKLVSLKARMNHSVRRGHSLRLARLDKVKNSMIFKQPYDRIYQERLHLDVLNKYMYKGLVISQERIHAKLGYLAARLDTLSPLKILSRGYSISKSVKDGAVIKSIRNVQLGDDIQISLNDGIINCEAKEIKEFK